MKAKKKNGSVEGYNKWGYIFLIPFAAVFIIFQLIPLISTVYYHVGTGLCAPDSCIASIGGVVHGSFAPAEGAALL